MGKRVVGEGSSGDAPSSAKRIRSDPDAVGGGLHEDGASDEAQGRAEAASDARERATVGFEPTLTGSEAMAFRLREPAPPTDAAPSTTVTAPAFRAVYDSWEAFDAALKFYSQATYQLYVIRTTTSVKRRNQRIAEVLAAAPSTGQEDAAVVSSAASGRALIPERFEWYSKTLMCTHGWKDRHRGNGKRAMSSIRSTCCPARMCVTLQQRGAGDADWQVVVTKHARQHNHPLSRELYFYYLENRRIYDPELLAVGGDAPPAPTGAWRPDIDPRELLSTEVQQTPPPDTTSVPAPGTTPPAMPASTSSARMDVSVTQMISEAAGSEFVLRSDATSTFVHATRASKKVHESWNAFNSYMTEYSESTNQVFRTRSTVSVAAKNAKMIERGDKAGRAPEETAALLIPEELKWYSKMLICNHGWKRKSRRKMVSSYYGSSLDPLFSGEDAGSSGGNPVGRSACPATLLVRLERDANDTWRVVINRQVVEHNHALTLDMYDADGAVAGIVQPASGPVTTNAAGTSNNDADDHQAPVSGSPDQLNQRLTTEDHEVVVRVPRLQNMFLSWEDFHENLRLYSDATYQLYCTRTTTSVVNRNRKIVAMKQQLEAERGSGEGHDAESSAAAESNSDTRLIPEGWKWYNKTLMCTHGWKRRPRGVGKRVAHVVRSTQCPVKICATVQYVETAGGAADRGSEAGGWRVVVTKHIVDHNHNLSRALYEHYRENRRIYDPDLLTIDETNEAAVVKPKASSVEMSGTEPPTVYQPPTDSATAEEDGIQQSASDAYSASVGAGDGNSSLQVGVVPAPQSIPSVVILPYQPSISSGMSSSVTPQNQRQVASSSSSSSGRSNSTIVSTGNGVATLAALAAPQPQMYVPYHIPEAVGSGGAIMMNGTIVGRHGFPAAGTQSGSAVFSLACPVHNGSGTVTNASSGSGDACTCFRLASSAQYVAIAPSRVSPHMMSIPQTAGFELAHVNNEHDYRDHQAHGDGYDGHEDVDVNGDADLEPTGDAWAPGAPVEIAPPIVNESGETMWRVPPMTRRHATWDTFHSYLDEYSAATFQLFSVRTTTAVSSRNTRIIQQVAKKNGNEESASHHEEMARQLRLLEETGQILPARFEWYAKTFLCTHGWKRRRRGIGKRVGHSVRSTQCPAKICATLQRSAYPTNRPGGVKKWRIVVTKQVVEHNHEISHAMYQKYSANRRVKDPEVLRAAERLWRSGSTRRQVFEFIKERAPQVPILMKDVHNIVQRWKKNPPTNDQDGAGRNGEGSEEGGEDEEGGHSSAEVIDNVTIEQ